MITERLARFVSEMPSSNISKEARTIARMAIMDIVGVMLVGSKEQVGSLITGYVKGMGGLPQSGVIGSGFKSSTHLAALANGTLAHAIDYDDVSFTMWEGHPSCCLVPPILAVGENIGASGADIISAYVVGFEVGACINSVCAQSHITRGWHGTSIIGTIGATAAVARLLKLNVSQVRMAFGIAASLAGGLKPNFGTMTKPLHAGHAASSGVMSALLAKNGFTAHESIIESPKGYAEVFGFEGKADWNAASKGLGKDFILARPGLEFKAYPACAKCTCAIEAALYLREKYKIDTNDIAGIELGITPNYVEGEKQFPTTPLEAEFSITYSVCRALIDGRVVLSNFTDAAIKQPDVLSLMKLTTPIACYPNATMGLGGQQSPQTVTVRLKNGEEYSHTVLKPRQMSGLDVENKFRDCTSLALDSKTVERLITLLRDIEKLNNIRDIMEIASGTQEF